MNITNLLNTNGSVYGIDGISLKTDLTFKNILSETVGTNAPKETKSPSFPTPTAPYSFLADENSQIHYNGVTFQCDAKSNSLCLGDMSNEKQILTIPLSEGGSLKVNVNNIDDLAKAIGMFSGADQKRILDALALYAKTLNKKNEIEANINQVYENLTSLK